MFLILDKILIIDVPCSWLKIREWLSEYFFFAKVCDKHNISVNCNNLDQIYSNWTFIIKASFHKISFSQNERLIISEFLIRHDLPEKLEAACGRRPQRPQVCRPLSLMFTNLMYSVSAPFDLQGVCSLGLVSWFWKLSHSFLGGGSDVCQTFGPEI